MNGVVVDDRGNSTGEVVAAPQDDTDSDDDLMDMFDAPDSDDEMNIESAQSEDDEELQQDANVYGRRITSGTGRQTRWDAGANKFVPK